MFKFNFSEEDSTDASEKESVGTEDEKWLESRQIGPSHQILSFNFHSNDGYNSFKCKNGVSIKCITSNCMTENMLKKSDENIIMLAKQSHSELVTGVYEGGLKLWECTRDLVDYLCSTKIDLKQKQILDLGCGVGIVGIFSLLKGARVCFQDYNPEVLESVTIPNVSLNLKSIEDVCTTSKFYSGDWESFSQIIDDNIFDYIFTSETIYHAKSYEKLHSVFKKCLKGNGTIYVAAKTHYFGIGGGLRFFEDFITNEGCFEYKSVWQCSDGMGREILKLNWKEKEVV